MLLIDIITRPVTFFPMKQVNAADALKKRRTIVDLSNDDLRRLDELAEQSSVPRAAILREAVAEYVVRRGHAPAALKPLVGFGSLKGYFGDGQAWQDQLRTEWE